MTIWGGFPAFYGCYGGRMPGASAWGESAKTDATEAEVAARGGADPMAFDLGSALNRAGDALRFTPVGRLLEETANAVLRAASPEDGVGVSLSKVAELQRRITMALGDPRMPPEAGDLLGRAAELLGQYQGAGGEVSSGGRPWASGSDYSSAWSEPGFGASRWPLPHYYGYYGGNPFEA